MTMIKMDARKLDNVDVSFVSLVARGANRIPFRIIKSLKEDGMNLDLGKLFSTKKAESPVVVAVVVSKESVTPELTVKLEAQGYAPQEAGKDDTDVVFKAAEYRDDSAVVKMDNGCAVVLSTVKKAFYSYPEGTDFSDNLAQNSFFPSVDMAQEVLEETIENIMYGSEIPAEAKASEVSAACDAFKGYVVSLTANLPVSAFELAKYVRIPPVDTPVTNPVVVKDEEGAIESEPVDEPSKDSVQKHQGTVEGLDEVEVGASESEEVVVAKMDTPSDMADAPSDMADMPTAEDDPEPEVDAHKALLETITGMAATILALSEKVDSLVTSNQALGEQVAKADSNATLAMDAVSGTVMSGSTEEEVPSTTVAKFEEGGLFTGTALDILDR